MNPTTLIPWSAHDTQLLIACALGLAIIIVSISVLKLAPFLSILVGTFAGFWMVREYFGLTLKRTVAVWSVLQTIVSVVGLVLTLALWSVLT